MSTMDVDIVQQTVPPAVDTVTNVQRRKAGTSRNTENVGIGVADAEPPIPQMKDHCRNSLVLDPDCEILLGEEGNSNVTMDKSFSQPVKHNQKDLIGDISYSSSRPLKSLINHVNHLADLPSNARKSSSPTPYLETSAQKHDLADSNLTNSDSEVKDSQRETALESISNRLLAKVENECNLSFDSADVSSGSNSYESPRSSLDSTSGSVENQDKDEPTTVPFKRTNSKRKIVAKARTRLGNNDGGEYSDSKGTLSNPVQGVREERSSNEGKCFRTDLEDVCPRSHTSLGHSDGVGSGFSKSGENCDQTSFRVPLPTGLPPRPHNRKSASIGGGHKRNLKRVPVSSRVELLMSNELFKRHLSNHQDLLQRHTLTYKKHGMVRSVSSLDLRHTDLFEEQEQINGDITKNSVEEKLEGSVANQEEKIEAVHEGSQTNEVKKQDDQNVSDKENSAENTTDVNITSKNLFVKNPLKRERGTRRHSLSGGVSDHTVQILSEENQRNLRTNLSQSVGAGPRSRPPIPSFLEFKQMRRNKILIRSHSDNKQPNSNKNLVNSQARERTVTPFVSGSTSATNDLVEEDDVFTSAGLDPIEEHDSPEHRENICEIPKSRTQKPVLNKETISSEKPLLKSMSEPLIRNLNSLPEKSKEKNESEEKYLKGQMRRLPSETDATVSDKPNGRVRLLPSENDTTEMPKSRTRRLPSETDSIDSDCSMSEISNAEDGQRKSSSSQYEKRKSAKRPRSRITKNLLTKYEMEQNIPPSPDLTRERKIIEVRGNKSGRTKLGSNKGDNSKVTECNSKSMKRKMLIREDSQRKLGSSLDDSFDNASQDTWSEVAASSSTSVTGSLQSIPDSISLEPSEYSNDDRLAELDQDMMERRKDRARLDRLTPAVLRSTSDACDVTPEALRKRRERKERPYKSDPFAGSEMLPASKRISVLEDRAIIRQHRSFATSSREEILDFLGGMCDREDSFPSLEELNEDDEQESSVDDAKKERRFRNRLSNVSSTSTDSGVIGQDGSHDSQESPVSTLTNSHPHSWPDLQAGEPPVEKTPISLTKSDTYSEFSNKKMLECVDCERIQRARTIESDSEITISLCSRCYKKRIERKETIQEIIDTEISYGRDLKILKEEFYVPMKTAGLLKQEQLDSIFLNLDELIHVNAQFTTKLKTAIHTANQTDDEDLHHVNIGSLFLESSTMFLTFENYCVNQSQAPVLLEQLEKEKELLRIFLHVSQSDNHLLRRMHLKSFLMVPVQRIMKYPLLLDRLFKTTIPHHPDKEDIKEAKDKIEDILGHINAKTKSGGLVRTPKRKISQKHHYSMTEKIEVSRVALQVLGWNRNHVCDLITSQLMFTQPTDHLWAQKRCKSLKFSGVYGVLMTWGEPNLSRRDDKNLMFPRDTPIKQAAVVLIREKNGKYQALRDPIMLDKCVVTVDPDYDEVFELLEWNKEPYLFRASNPSETRLWVQYLKEQTQDLGFWRKRRNAKPNILLNIPTE